MIGRLFSAALALTVLASTVTVQAKTAASPLVALQLKGHWVCVETGGNAGTFSEDWTSLFGGTWLRATDSVKGQPTAEINVTFNKATSTWTAISEYLNGTYTVLQGTGSGASRIAMHAVYPRLALAVTYTRVSPTKYVVDTNGNIRGKKFLAHSVCTKP